MFNIVFAGKLEDEKQLIESSILPVNAVRYDEGEDITEVLKIGGLLGLHILFIMLVIGIFRLSSFDCKITFDLKFVCIAIITIILFKTSIYLHEFIHCLFYPLNIRKVIWKDIKSKAYLAYCDKEVSKLRFIIISFAPLLIIGIFNFLLWYMYIPYLIDEIALCWFLFTWLSLAISVGDLTNIYNTIKQVPKGKKVKNYGYHSYWIDD